MSSDDTPMSRLRERHTGLHQCDAYWFRPGPSERCPTIAALDALEERAESMQAAFDVIWRLSCLPFTDDDRKGIQGIALAFIDGKGPQPGSQIAHLLAGDKEAE